MRGAVDECLAALEERGPDLHRRAGAAQGQDCPTIGSRGRRPCSAPPNSATTSTGRSRNRTARWTYFAADIAYHLDKFRRGFADLIDVWGADHGGYVKRMQAAVRAVTDGAAALDVKICQLVNLFDEGQPVRMSKRAGTFVTLREVRRRGRQGCFPLHDADPAQ